MRATDVWGRSDQVDVAIIAALADRLEARANNTAYMQMMRDYCAELNFSVVSEALVLGAGTGVEAREILRVPSFLGRVTAVELSPGLVEAGKAHAEKEQLSDRIEWIVGDAHDLGLEDDRFDLVLAHTLLSHVYDPKRVLIEAARVLKRTGTLIVFDGDYATLTYGTDDPEYGERMDRKIIQAMITNPRIMRSAPRLLRRLGFELVWSRCYAFNEIGRADFFAASLKSYLVVLPSSGVASLDEVREFVDDQIRASEAGEFFGGYNFITYICRPETEEVSQAHEGEFVSDEDMAEFFKRHGV